MKKELKEKILNDISYNTTFFDPSLKGFFLCPVCLKKISLDQLNKITEAHVIPESAGGKLKTWLCHICNSNFGGKQDKWFGEYLNAIHDHSLFSIGVRKKRISIDGQTLNGKIVQSENGTDIYIFTKKNNPNEIKKFLNRSKQIIKSINVSVDIPLLDREEEIKIGFITAAYLLGFSIFGYSWIQQKIFNNLRKLILSQCKLKDANVYIADIVDKQINNTYWFGIAIINDIYVPCAKIYSKVIFFPPYYKPDIFSDLKDLKGKYNIEIKKMMNVSTKNYIKPILFTVDKKVIIFPDLSSATTNIHSVVYIDSNSFEVQVLNQIVDVNFEKHNEIDRKIKIIFE